MRRIALLLVPAFITLAVPAFAQPKAENNRDVLLAGWTDIGEKVVKMAEEFPDNKYDYKPAEGVRTFGEVMRHVAFWNQWAAKTARGEKPDGKPNELPKAQYGTKAAIVAALKASVADGAAELKKGSPSPEPKLTGLWSSFISHNSEHYGQLVVYYRLNGIVPPASRGSN
jgi:uncharacterized damage-inducible protein DinB